MARPKNILETKTITLTLNDILIADLTQAVKTGLFGNSNAEAAERLIAQSLRVLIKEGVVEKSH
jgi:hypothetical protein